MQAIDSATVLVDSSFLEVLEGELLSSRGMCGSPDKNGTLALQPECKPTAKHPHRLLCVDDEKALVLLTARVLETNGYHVTALSNPREAVDLSDRENIELAVLDYEMPGMNGAHLAAQLKRARSNVKVILFTGVVQIPEIDLALMDAVVRKSDGVEALLASVNRLLTIP